MSKDNDGAAASGLDISEAFVKEMLKKFLNTGKSPDDCFSGLIDETFGRVIAVNQDMKYDPKIEPENLFDVATAVADGKMSRSAGELLKELREAAKYHNMKTIKIGADYFALIEPVVRTWYAELDREMNRFKQIVDLVQKSPYMGLQKSQPEALRMANFPGYLYIALRHHQATLTGRNEANGVEQAIKYVAKKMQPHKIKIFDAFASCLENALKKTSRSTCEKSSLM